MSVRLRWPDPVVYVVLTLLGAAVLVVYLDHRSEEVEQGHQKRLLHELLDHKAADVAVELKRTFEGPVFDTLTAVNHPILRAGRLDLVAQEFKDGLKKYPQVSRFFAWNAATESVAPDNVLFFDRESAARLAELRVLPRSGGMESTIALFNRDLGLGQLIRQAAARHAKSQQIYFAIEKPVGDTLYDIFGRLFWVDARRDSFFAMLGFVVDLRQVRTTLFPELSSNRLAPLLSRDADLPGLELRILDESDRVVFGPPGPAAAYAGESRFNLQFYPAEEIRSRMSVGISQPTWRVVVDQVAASSPAGWMKPEPYLLSSLTVVLMLVALAFSVVGSRRAAQLSRMQADFVAHVSHQLKTPLALLSAVAETLSLERVHPLEKQREYLGIVRSETSRLAALVDRILEFSRVDGRRRGYELEPIDLVALVQDAVAECRRQFNRDIEIEVEPAGGRTVVEADSAALEQVLVNLLDNAVKYSAPDSRIVVSAGCSGGDAVIQVTDGGIGIDAADQRRIFEKFYRGAGASHSQQGFGVGLAIVREVVKAHRGSIEVKSARGCGSTFTVRLPRLSERYQETAVAVGP